MTAFEKISDVTNDNSKENVIHFIDNDKECAFTFSQSRYVTKIRKLAEAHEEVKILHTNKDGSVVGRMPVKWAVKLSAPRQMSEEQREACRERFLKTRRQKRELVQADV